MKRVNYAGETNAGVVIWWLWEEIWEAEEREEEEEEEEIKLGPEMLALNQMNFAGSHAGPIGREETSISNSGMI